MRQKTALLRKLASTEWGYEKPTLRSAYLTAIRPTAEYAAAARMPWASASSLDLVEKAQRFAGRAIAGVLQSTPVEAVRAECNLPPIKTRAQQLQTIAYDKALRLSDANPRAQATHPGPAKRTKKQDWRTRASEDWQELFEEGQPEKFPDLLPPWLESK